MTGLPSIDIVEELEDEWEPDQQPRQWWPEAVRDEPRTDKFPWLALLTGLLPGLVGAILLLIPLVLLQLESAKRIVFVNQDGSFSAVQADGEELGVFHSAPLQLDENARREFIPGLPMLGLPEWSPGGEKLAATVTINNTIQSAIFTPLSGTVTLLSSIVGGGNRLVVPAGGWSPTGAHLALVETDGRQSFITLVDFGGEEPVLLPVSMALDIRAGLDWHPNGSQLLVTALSGNNATPSLWSISTNGTARFLQFSGIDSQRADGTWSPDGALIAYIVPAQSNTENANLHAGSLWVASSNGTNNRRLVSDGLNLAPIWDETDPDHVYFTRLITETASYELYRVNVAGRALVERVGSSSEMLATYPFDRQRYLRRSQAGQPLTISSTPLPAVNQHGWTADTIVRLLLRQSLPLLGFPQWSPDGSRLAATVWRNGKIEPALFASNLAAQPAPTSVLDVLAVPGDGWSADSEVLAFVGANGTRPLLVLYPVAGGQAAAFEFTLEWRAGLNWHPLNQELLVTGFTEQDPNPTLFVVDLSGSTRELTFNDGGLFRADGAWSPDGLQIAYVAGNTYTSTQDMLAGPLWVANSDGSLTRQLTDHLALAPLWNSAGDSIYYTRFDDATGQFDLYRVPADGSARPEYVGPGSELVVLYPWDRQVLVQWSPDGQQLLFNGANLQPPAGYLGQALNAETIAQVREMLPVAGVGQWSLDGRQFAGTLVSDGAVRVALYKSASGAPILTPETSDWIVMPADGWSPDGSYLALLRHDGTHARLSVLNTVQTSLGTASLLLDTRAGFSWRPKGVQVLVTALENEITPTLKLYDVNTNSTEDFVLDDGQQIHADGVWSPDGQQVAYITPATITDTMEMSFLAGALWVADQDGTEARQLVAEGLNFAPIWDLEQQRILFSRYLTETETFDLYRVDLSGENLVRLGSGSEVFAEFPFDRQLFRTWTPDGRRWVLPGSNVERPTVLFRMVTTETGMTVRPLANQCGMPGISVSRWAPTNRAVLVACPPGIMFLHWIDRERDNSLQLTGLYPSWQP